jgi:hypothetical protein
MNGAPPLPACATLSSIPNGGEGQGEEVLWFMGSKRELKFDEISLDPMRERGQSRDWRICFCQNL